MKTFTQFILEQDRGRIEVITAKDFPFTLDDIISCETEFLGPCDTPEGIKHVKEVRDTAKIEKVAKVFGYGSDFKKSENPDDFFYEVQITYEETAEKDARPYVAKWRRVSPGGTYQNRMLIGVNQEGKASVFAS